MGFDLPNARTVAVNPTQGEVRAWVLEHMERVTVTEFEEWAAKQDAYISALHRV